MLFKGLCKWIRAAFGSVSRVLGSLRAFVRRILRGYTFCPVSGGNRKLKSSAETRFIIWNLPAVITCPYATEMCKASCYARKAERVYKDVLPARRRNFAMSLRSDFVNNMTETIREIAEKKVSRRAVRVVVRIHESGDFYSQAYALKWLEIARNIAIAGFDNVVFMAYTKSLPYFDGETIPANFKIRASIWADTKPELVAMSQKYNIYTAYDAETVDAMEKRGEIFHRCRCDDCGACNECWKDDHKLIIVPIH